MSKLIPIVLATLLSMLSGVSAIGQDGLPDGLHSERGGGLHSEQGIAGRWICKRSDNVCGLDQPPTLSHPAKISYESVLKETAAMKELRSKGIDPNSPEGLRLRSTGQDQLKRAAEGVMRQQGHCSVWKSIRHSDGRRVPDVTALAKARL